MSADSSSNSAQPAEFWQGVEQFNQGDYYACHDTLEAIWMEAKTSDKGFYQGILQIAVGLYHLSNLNWKGAAILLGEGSHRLHAYGDLYGGIDLADLSDQATDWLRALQTTGPDQVHRLAGVLSNQSAENYADDNENKLSIPTIQTTRSDTASLEL